MQGKKTLKAFMREEAKIVEIVKAPAPPGFVDEEGKPVELEIRVLHSARIQEINENYKKRVVAVDKRGNPIVVGNEVAFKTERDSLRASSHILVEALAYPDLKDKELMDFFGVVDVTDMPNKVFPKPDEIAHVTRVVMAALGLSNEPDNDETKIDDIKN